MPRAIWTGTISFGLVNIPVRVFPATRPKDVRFQEIDRQTGRRIHHQRVLKTETLSTQWGGQGGDIQQPGPWEVRPDDVVKGFEIAPGRFVTVTAEEIEELRPERTKTIDIEEFVAADEVDAVYFDTAYHVAPQREFERPFALLVEALETSAKLAVCWIVLRKRRHLAALRPHEDVLLLSTMYFADEVAPVADIAPRSTEKPSDRELKMAALLVESMSRSYEPARYEDGYRKRLLDLIASRTGKAVGAPEPAEPVATSGVEELMAALEASLRQVRSTSRKRRAG
jgi:DNA end-binding protein Ku